MDLLSIAAETGSIEGWVDLGSTRDATLLHAAYEIGAADARNGVRVRTRSGSRIVEALRLVSAQGIATRPRPPW
ncbi:hypothetical protein PX554_17565 [Sphingomonas sp. H39-1-10]|uniref:hypothetical protein n=1 Tax=Sphingomonas TaxID=13687 RepID=UPI0008889FEB|nr:MULTISPECIES: hypothetical protein [Sphingomonas]MDF0489947.1 hypothetical protein [Sphingomonas pollutisoli]SDA36934.1 hypothetical protein SAMN03159340_04041 [Sphingomonas sp. NFR15]